jgi:hypothetical protein
LEKGSKARKKKTAKNQDKSSFENGTRIAKNKKTKYQEKPAQKDYGQINSMLTLPVLTTQVS